MRERGRSIDISSLAGRLAFPGSGVYHASKFAVEAISDGLRIEFADLHRHETASKLRSTPMDAIIRRFDRLGDDRCDWRWSCAEPSSPMSVVLVALMLQRLPASVLDRMWRRLFELDGSATSE